MELYEKNGNILYILNILKKYSDENHLLSVKEIKEKIKTDYNVDIDSRTIRRNINLLKEKFKFDISTFNENKIGYYILKDPYTDFETGEIRAIIDHFNYANYIVPNVANNIIKKCKNMQNIYENEKIKDYNIICNNTKTDNAEVIKNLEDISNAIFEKKKIKFTYWKYVLDNDILKKENVNTIECSPYNIVYNLQQFYVICLKNNASKLYTYRIDRMKNITILEDKVSTKFNKNEINDYIKSNVSMFSGKTEEIEFVCNTKLLDMIVEQFGKDIVLKKIDDNSFYAKVLSYPDGFKYFALRNLENIEVIKPISLRIKINNIINDYLNNLKTNKTE